MKNGINSNHTIKSTWLRIRSILLCVFVAIFLFSTATVAIAEGISQHGETRTQIKNRLMRQIRNDGWDPYSASMTIEEFYALMELFDEGKLPLKSKASVGLFGATGVGDGPSIEEPSASAGSLCIPRTMFIYAGLPDSYLYREDTDAPLVYENKTNYEPYDKSSGDNYKVQGDGADDEVKFQGATDEETFTLTRDNKTYTLKADGKLYNTDGTVDENATANFAYYYPEGLDKYNDNYKRPSSDWSGIAVDNNNMRVTIVEEGRNDEDKTTTGNTNQDLFVKYTDYYVRRVSISGTDISVLGMLKMPGTDKYVYYYLSTEGQSTQVSTTTLPDTAKFIVEYVPIERTVDYAIIMADDFYEQGSRSNIDASAASALLANAQASKSQGYVHENVKSDVTIDSVFTNRPDRTTDGAYAFDVLAPYGYTTKIYICIYMDKKTWFASTPAGDGTSQSLTDRSETKDVFPVGINHTGKKDEMEQKWLESYYKYLCDIKFINDSNQLWVGNSSDGGSYSAITVSSYSEFLNKCIKREVITDEFEDTTLKFTWNIANDTNKVAHDSMLERMAERINDFVLHNDGYALGTSPVWKYDDDNKPSKLIPNTGSGPSSYTWMETFYNHLVKADRTIVAVLEPIDAPMFDMSAVVTRTDNAKGRGSAATAQWAYATDEQLVEYYTSGKITGSANGGLDSSDKWPNIQTCDNWGWSKTDYQYAKGKVPMVGSNPYDSSFNQNDDGSYNYNFLFQTNSPGDNFLMDVLEINGVAMTIPYRPLYQNNYDNGNTPKPDEKFPWQTVNYLPDGAKVTVEFWFGWNNGQRHYRIRIEGVHVDVTITSLNLMQQGSGADEFSVYNLVGVYSGESKDQSTEGVEFYGSKDQGGQTNLDWYSSPKSQVIVNRINYTNGDSTNYGANIRFKVADGYGSPYYLWESPRYGIATDISRKIYQASVGVTKSDDGKHASADLENKHPIIDFSDIDIDNVEKRVSEVTTVSKEDEDDTILVDGKLNSKYIYYDEATGYYYIRVSGQYNPTSQPGSNDTLKIALLTIVAVPVGYVVRYVPSYYSLGLDQDGNPIHTSYFGDELTGVVNDPGNMPQFQHTGCVFAESAHKDVGVQYDDNSAAYYKRGTTSNIVSIPADPNGGVIRPTDPDGKYLFVNWVLVDADYQPILLDEQGRLVKRKNDGTYYYVSNKKPVPEHLENSIHTINYLGSSFDINDLADYAVHRLTFSDVSLDIYVLRFMPVWEKIENPFEYNVVLNWVDSKGVPHQEDFSDNWDKVITESPDDSSLFVYLNKDASPLLDWIAMHPTYTFWDAVNNAVTSTTSMVRDTTDPNAAALEQAIQDYEELIGADFSGTYDKILQALLKRDYTGGKDEQGNETGPNKIDDFARLGNYMFAVYEDGGTISIWMHETLGGVALKADANPDTYTSDEEFYFMIEADASINGTFKAYPQFVVPTSNSNSSDSNKSGDVAAIATQIVLDADAQSITFTDGIAYFTLKSGDEFALYIPRSAVTVTQLGSKSGGAYNVDVSYKQATGALSKSGVTMPDCSKNNVWLKGSSTTKVTDSSNSSVSQQSVTASFGAGQYVATIQFNNRIAGLSVKNTLQEDIEIGDGPNYYDQEYVYSLTIKLPEGQTPFVEEVEDEPSTIQSRIAGPVLLADDEQETETTTPNYYFSITIYNSNGTVVKSDNIYFEKIDSKDSRYPAGLTDKDNIWSGMFSLMDGQSASILMQVDPNSSNYWLNETNANGLYAQWTDGSGQQQESKKSNINGSVSIGTISSLECYNFKDEITVFYGYIYIAVSGGADTESFLFEVSGVVDGQKVSVVVSVKGGGHVYVYVPLGTYTITEISWAWRYSDISPLTVTVNANHNSLASACNKDKSFSVTGNNKGWLGGESSNSSGVYSSSESGN